LNLGMTDQVTKMPEKVLILGGGVGGVVAANVLSKTLPQEHRITLVDRNESHAFRGAYPFMLVNKRRPDQISRNLERLRRKGIEFIQAEIKRLRLEKGQVETDRGTLDYDYLIIALGAEMHPETVPGMAAGSYNPWSFQGADRLRQRLAAFREGKIVFFIASLPISCPPASYEVMFLLDAYFRERGLRSRVELTLVTPEMSPEPLAGPKVGESVRRMLEERGINLITQARVLSLDQEGKVLVLDHGITVPGDLFMGVPSHWGPSLLRETKLVEENGWIKVDPHTLETAAERVYAIGDAADLRLPVSQVIAPKAGIFAHYQAEVVSRNIAALLTGEQARFRYTAKGA